MSRRISHQQFTSDMFLAVKGKYRCSLSNYNSPDEKGAIELLCLEHGTFRKHPAELLRRNSGCPHCGSRCKNLLRTKNKLRKFKVAAPLKFRNKFIYDYSTFKGHRKPMRMICPEHGEFWSEPSRHLYSNEAGCPLCGEKLRTDRRARTPEYFIQAAIQLHGGLYNYMSVSRQGSGRTITYECPHHGTVTQPIRDHINGKKGCPGCGQLTSKNKKLNHPVAVMAEIDSYWPEEINFSEFVYSSSRDFFVLKCRKHGESITTNLGNLRRNHKFGHSFGCPICSNTGDSVRQRAIRDETQSLGLEVAYCDRTLLSPKEVDILYPEISLGIETCSPFTHSSYYVKPYKPNGKINTVTVPGRARELSALKWHMRAKQLLGEEKGIFIAQFDETVPLEKIVNYVKFKSGKVKSIFGRKTKICGVTAEEAEKLLNKYHIQGHVKGCIYYGLQYEGRLVAVIAFSKANSERGNKDPNRWELRRLIFNDCRVVGGASKLLKHFTRQHPEVTSIISYSDNRWFDGGVYKALKFKLVREVLPDYKYTKSGKLFHKAQFRHSAMKTRKNFRYDPNLTEKQNCFNNGFYQFFDCGKKKWELTL